MKNEFKKITGNPNINDMSYEDYELYLNLMSQFDKIARKTIKLKNQK